MPMMNGAGPPQGTGPMTGRQQGMQQQQAGMQQQQLVQQLRQMDQEQLVKLALDLITRLKQIEGQQPQAGGQTQQGPMR